jgi:hypothetical protein
VEGVRQRLPDLRQQLDLARDERRLPAPRPPRPSRGADDVSERELELLLDHQLNPPGSVEEVEKGQLAHLAPRHHASGNAQLVVERLAVLGPFRDLADRGDLYPVGEPLGQHRGAESKAAACDADRGGRAGFCRRGRPKRP